MAAPTDEQIKHVQTNLSNQMDWINHVHDYLQDIINEVYLKVSEDPTPDPGQTFVDNLIFGLISGGISSIPFPGSRIIGNFLGGMFHHYVTDPPPSLKGAAGSVWDRFDKSFLAANDDLSSYYNNVAADWDKTFTDPLGNTVKISDLDNTDVPGKTDQDYQKLTDAAVAAYKLNLTKELLPLKWKIIGDPRGVFIKSKNEKADFETFAGSFVKVNQAFHPTGYTTTGGYGCPEKGYMFIEPSLGTGSVLFPGNAPDDLCNWLFIDDGFGHTLNPDGLVKRYDVFWNWGLPGSLTGPIFGQGPGGDPVTAAVEEVSKEDRTLVRKWHVHFGRNPRKDEEQKLIDKALSNQDFLVELMRKPKETIAKEVGLEFPSYVKVEVIQERAEDYKMVIPFAGRPKGKKGLWRRFFEWMARIF